MKPNVLGLQSAKDQRALLHVLQLKQSLQSTHDAINERNSRYRDLYRGIWRQDTHQYDGRSRLALKEVMKSANILAANVTLRLFPDEFFKLVPRKAETEDRAERNQRYISYQVERSGARHTASRIFLDAEKYGFGVGKVMYTEKRRRLKAVGERQELIRDAQGSIVFDLAGIPRTRTIRTKVDKDVVDYRGGALSWVDPFNFWFDPRYEDLQQGAGVMEEYSLTWQEILALEKQGVFHNVELLGQIGSMNVQKTDDHLTETTGVPVPEQFEPLKKFRIHDFWGLWDPEDTGEFFECRIVVINESIVVHADFNPFWHGKRPYLKTLFIDSDDGLGIGLCETVESDAINLDDITNQRNDNITLILNAMFKYKKGSVRATALYVSPGHGIPWRDDKDDVDFLRPPDVARSAYLETDIAKQAIRETWATTNPVQGVPSTNKTATEVSALIGSANVLFQWIIQMQEHFLVKPMIEMFHFINQQTHDQAVTFRLGLDELETIAAEDLVGLYDVIPTASSQLLNRADAENYIRAIELGVKLSQLGIEVDTEFGVMYRRVLEALGFRQLHLLKKRGAPPLALPAAMETPAEIGTATGAGGFDTSGAVPAELVA